MDDKSRKSFKVLDKLTTRNLLVMFSTKMITLLKPKIALLLNCDLSAKKVVKDFLNNTKL